jgi:DNA primase
VKPETTRHFGLGFCKKGLMAGRVVIPIHNARGELVAYAGRAIDTQTEEEGKYKLPKDFKKGHILFNLHRVVEAIGQGEPITLVEGFFDVFRLYELGYPNTIALMGSEFTAEQEGLLKSILTPASDVALLFDNDEAGHKCRRDVALRLWHYCFIKGVELPKDITQPDQLKRKFDFCEEGMPVYQGLERNWR